jgi:type I restriction enzyme S subunit
MREGWTYGALDDLADYRNGRAFKPGDFTPSGLPVIRIKQFLDPGAEVDYFDGEGRPEHLADDGDIIFSWSGTLAVGVWDRGPAWVNQHLFKVEPREGIHRQWLPLAIEHCIPELNRRTHGSTMRHITRSELRGVRIGIPPLAEQRRIVDLIGSLDATITATDKAVAKAEQARRAVLTDLLAPPSVAAQSATADGPVRPAMRDGWVQTTLGDIATWHSGGTPKAGDSRFYSSTSEGYPWAVIADLSTGRVCETATRLTPTGLAEIGGRLATAGSVLLSMYGSIGKVAIAECPMATNQAIAWAEADPATTDPAFLALQVSHLGPAMAAIGRGATQKNINRQIIRAWPVLLPPLDEQRRIVDIISTLDDEVAALKSTAGSARAMRAGLLSELLSGNHEIPSTYDRLLEAA